MKNLTDYMPHSPTVLSFLAFYKGATELVIL